MGTTATLAIKETLAELTSLLSKQKTLTGEKRIKSLIYIENNKFKTRQEVSYYTNLMLFKKNDFMYFFYIFDF